MGAPTRMDELVAEGWGQVIEFHPDCQPPYRFTWFRGSVERTGVGETTEEARERAAVAPERIAKRRHP